MPDDLPLADATHAASDDSDDDPRIVAAVKEYLTLLDKGRPSRREFLARHSEIADRLADYLDGLEMVHGAGTPMRNQIAGLTAPQLVSLGDFRILREIGRGGMGIVYEALHVSLARRVALKILPSIDSFDALRLQRFKTEAQAAARLAHPSIVQVYSVGCEGNVHYYAMQLVDGFPLSAIIQRLRQLAGKSPPRALTDGNTTWAVSSANALGALTRGVANQSTNRPLTKRVPLTGAALEPDDDRLSRVPLIRNYPQPQAYIRESARLIQSAAAALEHAHQSGVVHRDIKPGNLLVNDQGQLWVADFGLARIEANSQLTRTGTPLGTARYMSPEQASGNVGLIDHRADVYSLGVTLYELLTLEPAIPGDDSPTLLRRVVEDEPRPPRVVNTHIPRDLETIVLKSIAKERDERYTSAQHMADDLQRWLDDKPIVARPPTGWERAMKWGRRHRWLVKTAAAIAAIAMCALIAVTWIVSRAYRNEAHQRQAAVASFEQARQAVDTFAEFGETELAAKPELRDVRRRLLETALRYYREFQRDHADDPQALAEMATTTERIGRIVDELIAIEDAAPLMLLANERVQDDLQLTDEQRQRSSELFSTLNDEREAARRGSIRGNDARLQQAAELLQAKASGLLGILRPDQLARLQQIARQQRTPFVFRTSEVIDALQLTPQQRQQINTIIEEDRIDGRGRGGRGQGPFAGDGRDERRRGGGPPDFGAPDEWPGPPDGPRGEGWGRRGGRRGGPDFGPSDRGDGPPGMMAARNRTTARTLEILTPGQRAAWEQLIGRPFEYDLHWGPDDILPR